MRNIRFRGWHAPLNRMFSPEEMEEDQLTLLTTGSFINVNGTSTKLSTIYPTDKFIPMQSTGLFDKNGKEIFEGDLIRVEMCECTGHDDEGNEIWIDCEGPVSFEDGAFVFDGHSAGTIPLSAYIENITVIGHIYEDHERQIF